MGIGTKRICQSCAAKFYDLEKDPIKCPKCDSIFDPELVNKPKRGRKKATAAAAEPEEMEIVIDDEVIEELDDDAALEEMDEETRDEMEIDNDDNLHEKKGDKILVDLEEDSDGIMESGDTPDKE